MAQITASLLSAACIEIGFLVFTISTLTPLDNIGVMTMKMMSITSITSTIGVTLMSATGGGALYLVAFDFSLAIVCLQETGRRGGPVGSPSFNSPESVSVRGIRLLLAGAGSALRPLH